MEKLGAYVFVGAKIIAKTNFTNLLKTSKLSFKIESSSKTIIFIFYL